jgi:hypothetical protein
VYTVYFASVPARCDGIEWDARCDKTCPACRASLHESSLVLPPFNSLASRRCVAGYEAAPACVFADCLCHGAVLAKSQSAMFLVISSRAILFGEEGVLRTHPPVNLIPMHDQCHITSPDALPLDASAPVGFIYEQLGIPLPHQRRHPHVLSFVYNNNTSSLPTRAPTSTIYRHTDAWESRDSLLYDGCCAMRTVAVG